MRNCPFNECQQTLPDSLFACRKHWYSLNAGERAEIWAAYGAYLEDRIGIEELTKRQQAVLGERGTA